MRLRSSASAAAKSRPGAVSATRRFGVSARSSSSAALTTAMICPNSREVSVAMPSDSVGEQPAHQRLEVYQGSIHGDRSITTALRRTPCHCVATWKAP